METVILRLENEGRYGTAHVYQSTLNAILRYWQIRQKGTIKLDKVFTPVLLQDFERYLLENMLSMNTVSTYMRMLRAIYHRATKEKRIKWRQGLFDTVYTGVRADTKRSLTAKHMGNILVAQQSLPSLKEAQSWFTLLFLLRGMPFIDLARLRKCDLYGDTLIYKEAMRLIKQLANRNPQSPYLLSILPSNSKLQNGNCFGSKEEYRLYQAILRGFNRRLNELSRRMNLGEKLSSYTARHTWATTAYQKKCATGVICNALGHSSIKVTETYLKAFEQKEIDRTNRMIISYIKQEAEKANKNRNILFNTL